MSISRCRYFWCQKCTKVYAKDQQLKSWRTSLIMINAVHHVSGTRTCSCGNIFQVQDIYDGVYDLPRQYWNQVEAPVEI